MQDSQVNSPCSDERRMSSSILQDEQDCMCSRWLKITEKVSFQKNTKIHILSKFTFFRFFSKFFFFSKWDFLWFFQTLWCYVDVVFSPAPVVDCWFFYAFCTFSLFHCSLHHSSVFSVFPDVLLYLFLSPKRVYMFFPCHFWFFNCLIFLDFELFIFF